MGWELFCGGGVAVALVEAIKALVLWLLDRHAKNKDGKKESEEDWKEKMNARVNSLTIGERAILRDRIKYLGKCYIRAKAVDIDDRQDLVDMHSAYHGLGGNGNLDALMAQVMALPLL